MNYPQHPPVPPEQGPHWPGGDYPLPQYDQSEPHPPPRQSLVGTVLLGSGIVVIIALVVAIIMVIARGNGSQSSEQDPSALAGTIVESTPEQTTDPTPESTPEQAPEEVGEGSGLATGVFPYLMDGDWSGTMTQYAPDGSEMATWDLELHMFAGKSIGAADLTLNDGTICRWDILAVANTKDTAELEYYTTDNGGGMCTDSGTVHITLENGQLTVGTASTLSNGETTVAEGILK